ncbi:MAG: uroporphyrin-III methyltransferase [Ruminococcus sp.]|nr:uroporphyrin-III methyltransferase [Ruminococcus sp.]
MLDEVVDEDFREFVDELDFYYSGYDDIEDVAKALNEAGYDDIIDLEYMDEDERNEALTSAGLDPEDFSF